MLSSTFHQLQEKLNFSLRATDQPIIGNGIQQNPTGDCEVP